MNDYYKIMNEANNRARQDSTRLSLIAEIAFRDLSGNKENLKKEAQKYIDKLHMETSKHLAGILFEEDKNLEEIDKQDKASVKRWVDSLSKR